MHVELRVNMPHVGFHRVVRQHELFLNDGARASARKQLEYLGFARGEAMLLGDGGAGGFERGVVRFLLKPSAGSASSASCAAASSPLAFFTRLSVWAGVMPSMVSAKL